MNILLIWPRHFDPGHNLCVSALDQRCLSFIFFRTPVLDIKVYWDLCCHGKSTSGSGITGGPGVVIDRLAYISRSK